MATKLFGNQTEYHYDGIGPFWAEDGAFEEEEGDETPDDSTEQPPEDPKEAGYFKGMQAERAKRQALEARLAEIETAQQERERKAAEEQGEFKRLYEETTAKASSLEEEVNKYRAAEAARIEKLEASNEKALADLPEHLRGLVPEGLSPDAKAEQLAKLARIAGEDLPKGGRVGSSGKVPKETIPAECIAEAKQHGKPPEFWYETVWKPRIERLSRQKS